MKAIDLPMKAPEGRPDKSKIVEDGEKHTQTAEKPTAQRDTGLDPKTIRKWWK